MAITFIQQPQLYTPSDNPIIWIFESSNYNQANFSFFVEVYVNGVLTSEHLLFPQVNDDRTVFDASDTASIACSSPTLILNTPGMEAGNYASISIIVYERYGTPPVNNASVNSSSIRAFKACLSDESFNNWDYQDYAFNVNNSLWLTQLPRSENMMVNETTEHLFLTAITDNYPDLVLEVTLYNSLGVLLYLDTITVAPYRITIMDVSPVSIIANSGITAPMFAAASYYTVFLTDDVDDGETLRIDLDRRCGLYSPKRLHFLSSIGGVDSFTFTKANKETRTIDRANMERQFGSFNAIGDYVFDLQNGRESTYLTTSSGRQIVSSDWLRETVQNWLVRELYESPLVYIEKLVGASYVLSKVVILNSGYELKQELTEPLFQETVEIGLTDSRKSMLV